MTAQDLSVSLRGLLAINIHGRVPALARGHVRLVRDLDCWILSKQYRPPMNSIIEELGTEICWEILGSDGGWCVWATHYGSLKNSDNFKFTACRPTLNDALTTVAEELLAIGPEWVRATDEHDSDCATHNMPAHPNGPCDCSLSTDQGGQE